MAFAGYRVVVLTSLANGGVHRTPWSRWMPRDEAERVCAAWSKTQQGRTLAVESKRGVLRKVGV